MRPEEGPKKEVVIEGAVIRRDSGRAGANGKGFVRAGPVERQLILEQASTCVLGCALVNNRGSGVRPNPTTNDVEGGLV